MSKIITIGGAPAAGKSTVSGRFSEKLCNLSTNDSDNFFYIGTDLIREILRSYMGKEEYPEIYLKGITAADLAPDGVENKDIWGFQTQAEFMQPAVTSLIKRVIYERRSVIVEGIHIFPNLIDKFDEGQIVNVVLTVKDKEQLRSQMLSQGLDRSKQKLDNIHRAVAFQEWLISEAEKNDTKVILNEYNLLDKTVEKIVDLVS